MNTWHNKVKFNEVILNFATVILSALFDNYYLIID
jgi:hypothetical protein